MRDDGDLLELQLPAVLAHEHDGVAVVRVQQDVYDADGDKLLPFPFVFLCLFLVHVPSLARRGACRRRRSDISILARPHPAVKPAKRRVTGFPLGLMLFETIKEVLRPKYARQNS